MKDNDGCERVAWVVLFFPVWNGVIMLFEIELSLEGKCQGSCLRGCIFLISDGNLKFQVGDVHWRKLKI
jgi:hypothetical protein